MRNKLLMITLLFLSQFLIENVNAQKTGEEYHFYKNAENLLLKQERLVWTGVDNLILYPLDFFEVGTFTRFYGGAAGTEIINFEINDKQKNINY